MGANAATKLLRVLENTLNIHAMEWLTAAQAMDFRKDWHLTPNLELLRKTLREKISFLDNDRFMHADIQTLRARPLFFSMHSPSAWCLVRRHSLCQKYF